MKFSGEISRQQFFASFPSAEEVHAETVVDSSSTTSTSTQSANQNAGDSSSASDRRPSSSMVGVDKDTGVVPPPHGITMPSSGQLTLVDLLTSSTSSSTPSHPITTTTTTTTTTTAEDDEPGSTPGGGGVNTFHEYLLQQHRRSGMGVLPYQPQPANRSLSLRDHLEQTLDSVLLLLTEEQGGSEDEVLDRREEEVEEHNRRAWKRQRRARGPSRSNEDQTSASPQ